MKRVVSLSSFEDERKENPTLAYWLSRPPEERIAEVERLRGEYLAGLRGTARNGHPERLRRSLRLIEREER